VKDAIPQLPPAMLGLVRYGGDKNGSLRGRRLVKQHAAEKSAAETEATRLADVKLTSR